MVRWLIEEHLTPEHDLVDHARFAEEKAESHPWNLTYLDKQIILSITYLLLTLLITLYDLHHWADHQFQRI